MRSRDAGARPAHTGDSHLLRGAFTRGNIEGKNSDGTLAFQQDCSANNACTPQLPSATYTVTLEGFDPDREQITAESCDGVPSMVIQQACANGPLRLTMRGRLGDVQLTPSFSSLQQNIGSTQNSGYRFEFADDPSKFWLIFSTSKPVRAGHWRWRRVRVDGAGGSSPAQDAGPGDDGGCSSGPQSGPGLGVTRRGV